MMQAIGCSSSFTNGALWIGMRESRSACKLRATTLSSQDSLAFPGEDEFSTVDYDDVATQWLSADFLNLRLRSSGLICNEAIQALRHHFVKKEEQPAAAAVNVMQSTSVQQSFAEQDGALSAYQGNPARSPPNVIVLDEALFPQLYNSGSTYTTPTCNFLDESFC